VLPCGAIKVIRESIINTDTIFVFTFIKASKIALTLSYIQYTFPNIAIQVLNFI